MTNAQNHNFTGRKPSKAQILSKAKAFDQSGSDFVSITWGENWIDLQKDKNGYWHGSGWIRDISGDWVARELNHCPRKALNAGFVDPIQFLRNHLTVIHIK
jgi:hypothetical protein